MKKQEKIMNKGKAKKKFTIKTTIVKEKTDLEIAIEQVKNYIENT